MSTKKVTLAHGPDGYIVQAIATGFDLEHGDMAMLDDLRRAVVERAKVFAFDDDIEVAHIFEPDFLEQNRKAFDDELARPLLTDESR